MSTQHILSRRLGLFDSAMMMVGIVIGSGIFLTTGIMAQSVPSAGLILLAWLTGGVLTLCGALTLAELGAAMPEVGGLYVYLREAYGHLYGFLFGWVLFLVSMGGSIAALAVGFASYLGYFVPWVSSEQLVFGSVSTVQLMALLVVVGLSAINFVGVGPGKTLQNLFTVAKIGAILAFGALAWTAEPTARPDLALAPAGADLLALVSGFGVALVAVSWAFDGWHNVTYSAGEIKNPGKNLPLVLVGGTLLITSLYLLVNYVYVVALPVQQMAGVVRIAERASGALQGSGAAGLISAMVLVSIFGALNGTIFAAPRVYYAMARDGVFFRKVAEIHPRFRTPAFAIALQAAWASLLTLTGSYEQLFTYVVFVTFIFWISTTASVFALRRKRPDLARPYKTWGYPIVPLVFITAIALVLVNTLIAKPVESLAGLGITLAGIPAYHFWRRSQSGSATSM